jgi:WD40 repeat protein
MSPKTGTPKSRHGVNVDTRSEIYSLSPVRYDSQKMLLSPRKQPRAVSKVPYKVLDAPELADDFYLNLVDWGSTNILGVGLGSCVYMWNSNSGKVTKLCDLGTEDNVTSVSWIQRVGSSGDCMGTVTNIAIGIAYSDRDEQGLCTNLGCEGMSPITHDDGSHRSRW